MLLATAGKGEARYDFIASSTDRATVSLYQRRDGTGGLLDKPFLLGEEQGDHDHSRLMVVGLADRHIGGGTLWWHFTGDDPWAEGAALAEARHHQPIRAATARSSGHDSEGWRSDNPDSLATEGLGPVEVTDEAGVTARGARPTAAQAAQIRAGFTPTDEKGWLRPDLGDPLAAEGEPALLAGTNPDGTRYTYANPDWRPDPRTEYRTNPTGGSTVRVTITREQQLAAVWMHQRRRLEETGVPGSPQFVACVQILVAGSGIDAEWRSAIVAKAHVVPHLAVAGEGISQRAKEFFAWCVKGGGTPTPPDWWRREGE